MTNQKASRNIGQFAKDSSSLNTNPAYGGFISPFLAIVARCEMDANNTIIP